MGGKKWLADVAQFHDEWVAIVKSFGERSYHEDIVQQSYLALYKYSNEEKVLKNGKVNKAYIWIVLRSMFLQYVNAKNKVHKVSIDDEQVFLQIPNIDEMDEEINYHNFTQKIDKHIESWRWYDRSLFKIYRDTPMSIRKIANKTNISWVSIFHTLKKCKEELKEIFKDEYKEYKRRNTD